MSKSQIVTGGIADDAVTANKTSGVARPNVNPLIINGDMALSQRNGTTATTIGAEAYSLDRWSFREISNGTTTVQQTTTVPSGKGFANSAKVAVTGADTSIVGDNIVAFAQKLEGQDVQLLKFGTSDAQKVTISFWVRSNVTGTYSATLRHTNTSGTAYVNCLTFSISSADTWEQKVLVFNGNTAQDIRNTNTEGLRLEIILTAGSDYTSGGGANANTWTTGNTNRASASNVNILSSTSNTFYLTGVQLEVGEYTSSTLPPFQHESFGDNLQRCSRYYQRAQADSDTYKHFGLWFCAADTGGGGTGYGTVAVPLVTTMRTVPSLETTGTVSNYAIVAKNTNYALTTFSVDTGIDDGTINGQFYLNAYSGGGMGAGTAGAVRANNTADAFVALDAEL